MSTHQANQSLLGEISDLMKREHYSVFVGTQGFGNHHDIYPCVEAGRRRCCKSSRWFIISCQLKAKYWVLSWLYAGSILELLSLQLGYSD